MNKNLLKTPVKITEQSWSGNDEPLVSVFNWVFNHKDFIRESIETILIQETTFPVEIIIHDDASNDGSLEIIKEYVFKYPQLFKNVLQFENQWSQGKSVMTSLFNKPRGKYIALTHGDDYWTDPLKLQKQVDFLEANDDFAICGSLAKRIYDNPTVETDVEGEAGVFEQKDVAFFNFIPTASVLFRRDALADYPLWAKESPIGDLPLFLICSNHGKIKMFGEQMVVRRIHAGGIWGANINNHNSIKNLLRSSTMYHIAMDKFSEEVNLVLKNSYLKLIIKIIQHYIKQHDFNKTEEYLQILFQKGFNLHQESDQLTRTIIKKMISQEAEITKLQLLNTKLMESTSYKLGRNITGFFKFLKRT